MKTSRPLLAAVAALVLFLAGCPRGRSPEPRPETPPPQAPAVEQPAPQPGPAPAPAADLLRYVPSKARALFRGDTQELLMSWMPVGATFETARGQVLHGLLLEPAALAAPGDAEEVLSPLSPVSIESATEWAKTGGAYHRNYAVKGGGHGEAVEPRRGLLLLLPRHGRVRGSVGGVPRAEDRHLGRGIPVQPARRGIEADRLAHRYQRVGVSRHLPPLRRARGDRLRHQLPTARWKSPPPSRPSCRSTSSAPRRWCGSAGSPSARARGRPSSSTTRASPPTRAPPPPPRAALSTRTGTACSRRSGSQTSIEEAGEEGEFRNTIVSFYLWDGSRYQKQAADELPRQASVAARAGHAVRGREHRERLRGRACARLAPVRVRQERRHAALVQGRVPKDGQEGWIAAADVELSWIDPLKVNREAFLSQ